ncbi:hypothetical protein CPB83DRAFT_843605 [Crepidotus variabilis]|uniref:Uncharacterized protein n=1 Tax=Crepidotus variabilis TaxID=179855 RepID=A0A9P6JWY2_9AGAR|nr:hypothetical protein CPB83DRAFT_843605 [Crepidotus variabilis]
MMLAYILLVATVFSFTAADRNITLDDTDPSILYFGDWLPTPFDQSNAGGTHKVTATPDASAALNFTGVAIYFYSPLWPFRVTTALSLDGQPSELLDLRDYDAPFLQDGPESQSSQVVWWADGLENTQHILNVSVGAGEDLAILDQLVYTIKDSSNSTAPASSIRHHRPSQSRTMPVASATSSAVAAASSSKKNNKVGLSVTLSIVCVLFGIFCVWGLYWYWQRRKRRLAEGPSSPGVNDPEMSESTSRRYPRTTGLMAAGRDRSRVGPPSSSGSSRSRWRRPAPPPPRSVSRGGGPNTGMRAHKTLSTIPETSGDGDTLKQTLSISEVQERPESQGSQESHESATLSSPSSMLPYEGRTDPDISLSPTKPSIRLVNDNR